MQKFNLGKIDSRAAGSQARQNPAVLDFSTGFDGSDFPLNRFD
jgi:hypothetical protein